MADICVALDMAAVDDALRLVDEIADGARWYKVGPILHVAEGRRLIEELRRRRKRVFLDLKWHDIPNTVAGAVQSASTLGVELATVHLLGGRKMLRHALDAARGAAGEIRLVGVGILTSHTAREFGDILGRPLDDAADEQERLMRIGLESGLDGFVTAATELRHVRSFAGPEAFLVTPGIRRTGDSAGDQARTATPADAVSAGADLLVVGRPVTAADDPAAAVAAIRQEMNSG